MTQPSAEWRSGQRVGLITQRSQDRNLAPLFMSICGRNRRLKHKSGGSRRRQHAKMLMISSLASVPSHCSWLVSYFLPTRPTLTSDFDFCEHIVGIRDI